MTNDEDAIELIDYLGGMKKNLNEIQDNNMRIIENLNLMESYWSRHGQKYPDVGQSNHIGLNELKNDSNKLLKEYNEKVNKFEAKMDSIYAKIN